ncbi:MAG: hypothetical protein H7250_02380 [Flavobacterium sp.]|nr:hypothetical protein [Flavobacterium sp.]
MKLYRELQNGIIIFLAIGIYFLLMEALGLSDRPYLRVMNLFIVIFGVNRTLKVNFKENVNGYFKNLMSGFITAMIGSFIGIIALMIYINYKGGEAYLKMLSSDFLFGGGNPSIPQYCIGLLFESAAASMIICFCLMQYWKTKVEKINKVD